MQSRGETLLTKLKPLALVEVLSRSTKEVSDIFSSVVGGSHSPEDESTDPVFGDCSKSTLIPNFLYPYSA